jgi:hypothetical protein
MLPNISIGWAWLNSTLNKIIDEVNQNKPLSSGSIGINRTNAGSLITLTNTDLWDKGGGGGRTFPKSFVVKDCAFKDFTVLNPDDCSQSTATFLIRQPGTDLPCKLAKDPVKKGVWNLTITPPQV